MHFSVFFQGRMTLDTMIECVWFYIERFLNSHWIKSFEFLFLIKYVWKCVAVLILNQTNPNPKLLSYDLNLICLNLENNLPVYKNNNKVVYICFLQILVIFWLIRNNPKLIVFFLWSLIKKKKVVWKLLCSYCFYKIVKMQNKNITPYQTRINLFLLSFF